MNGGHTSVFAFVDGVPVHQSLWTNPLLRFMQFGLVHLEGHVVRPETT